MGDMLAQDDLGGPRAASTSLHATAGEGRE